MTRTIAYARVSTADQAEHGRSLEAQEAKLRAYATLYGLELVALEVDAGESAGSLARPALQRALARLKRKEADSLLVVKLDRLTRSVEDLCQLVRVHFTKRALLSVEEKLDTSTASGKAMLQMMTVMAEWERGQASERTAAVKRHQRARGEYIGGIVPVGRALEFDAARSDAKKARYKLVPLAGELEVVAQARALREAGLSLRAVSAALAERGIVARCGRPWSPQSLADVLARAETL